jgi:membrane-associated protease RseP (regulator of RpoE activity)
MRTITRRTRAGLVALSLAVLFAAVHVTSAAAKPWLGVYTQVLTDDLRDGLEVPAAAGVLVSRVVPNGPADRAGLQQGDVIVRLNSRAVESPAALARLVAEGRDGQEVELQLLRRGARRVVAVKLATLSEDDDSMAPPAPEAPSAPPAPGDRNGREPRDVKVKVYRHGDGQQEFRIDGDMEHLKELRGMLHDVPGLDGNEGLRVLRVAGAGRGRLGVRIESLNEDLAAALGAPGTDGVLVLEVMPDTPAERAGMRSGDVILAVEGSEVKNAEGLVRALRDVDGKVSLTVTRKGARRTIEAELAAAPRLDRGEGPGSVKRMMGGPDTGDRLRGPDDADSSDLRQEMKELRQQLRELRQQLEERRRD